jgi:hypothetical protein
MPALSLWKDGLHSADYRFIDKQIRGMIRAGGTGVLIHKYLSPQNPTTSNDDATEPTYTNQSEMNIQDLLFLENRDRVYDPNIYSIRGHYNVNNLDFDLTQFGLYLSSDIIFVVFHINDMIDVMGRKLMVGDVIELPHLRDYNPLNTTLDASLARFYVIQDAANASEGFSQTWWPHLWRVKCGPLVDSQEYQSILTQISASENVDTPVGQLISTYQTQINIGNAILDQATANTPMSGYDTSAIYVLPVEDNMPASEWTITADNGDISADDSEIRGDTTNYTTNQVSFTGDNFTINADLGPISPAKKVKSYLGGDGIPPNGFPVTSGIVFPTSPVIGDYALRIDFLPNRLFRWNGTYWVKIEDVVRSNVTPGATNNTTQLENFYSNTATFTDDNGVVQPSRQSLSDALIHNLNNPLQGNNGET